MGASCTKPTYSYAENGEMKLTVFLENKNARSENSRFAMEIRSFVRD